MAYVRTTDGTVVEEGKPTSETAAAKFWRWPTKWLPDSLIDSPAVVVLPFVFWGAVLWIVWRKFVK